VFYLTETDSVKIIYNTCDAGNSLIRIDSKKSKHAILLYGQQGNDHFDVKSATVGDNDAIHVDVVWSVSTESKTFKLFWIDK